MVNEYKNTMDDRLKDFEAEILSAFNLPPDEIEDLKFITRSGSIDWNKIVTVDIEDIIKGKNFAYLKDNVINIINYDLESSPSAANLEPAFVKLFRMAQLTIEYLLHVQRQLCDLVSRSNNNKKSIQEMDSNRKVLKGLTTNSDEFNSSPSQFNLRKGRRLFVLENEFSNILQCSICDKIFLHEHYLSAHHQRRHSGLQQQPIPEGLRFKPNMVNNISESLPIKLQEETNKIWKELEILRKKVAECETCNIENKDTIKDLKKFDFFGRNDCSEVQNVEVMKLSEKKCDCKDLKTIEDGKSRLEDEQKDNESKVKEDGRLEAQERFWRGRLKALSDESQKEIESLKQLISSFKQKEERYELRIGKLTSELREKSMRQQENQMTQEMEEEVVVSESNIENVKHESHSSDASEDTVSSSHGVKGPTNLNSTFTYGADEDVKSSGSEVESSGSFSSVTQRTLDEDLEEEESQIFDTREITIEMFNHKLKNLGINPKTKKMSLEDFKEKMDVLKKLRKDLGKNIEGYHQIKSNIEEKALAKVSQRLQGPHGKLSRSLAELSSHNLEKFAPKHVKKRKFENFEFSPKDTSTPSTSRSSSSSHNSAFKQKSSLKISPNNTSTQWRSVLGAKNSKGMVTVKSYTHPKEQRQSFSFGSQGIHISTRKNNHSSSSGGILRGVTIESGDRNADTRFSTSQSLGNIASKSVSFSLANSG